MIQVMALQKLNILPDIIISLSIRKKQSLATIRNNLQLQEPLMSFDQLYEIAERMYMEINYHQQVVEKILNRYLYKFDCKDHTNQHDISNELITFLRARTRRGDNPPKIAVIGPPGSGRSLQSEKISKRFGLVVISPEKLIEEEIGRNPGLRLTIRALLGQGLEYPDALVT